MTCPRCHSRYVATDVSARRHWCSTCGLAWVQGERFDPAPNTLDEDDVLNADDRINHDAHAPDDDDVRRYDTDDE